MTKVIQISAPNTDYLFFFPVKDFSVYLGCNYVFKKLDSLKETDRKREREREERPYLPTCVGGFGFKTLCAPSAACCPRVLKRFR